MDYFYFSAAVLEVKASQISKYIQPFLREKYGQNNDKLPSFTKKLITKIVLPRVIEK